MAQRVEYIMSLRDNYTKKVTAANKATNMMKRGVAALGVTFSAALVARGIGSAIKAFGKQEQAMAQVQQGLLSTNNAAGKTFSQLTKQASKLQSEGIFGDEDILQNVTAQMLTFTNVTGENFDKVQQAALDVTARLYGANASGESLRSTSIQLGKALNDPVSNLGALGRMGIQFSKQQKEVIKGLAESGKQAEAQAIVLKELEKQYGGSNKAAAKTASGGLKQLKNSFGDLTEQLGKKMMPAITGTAKLMKKMIEIPLEDKLRKEQQEMNALATAFMAAEPHTETRKRLMKEMTEKYPQLLEGYKGEVKNTDLLRKNLERVNVQYSKRIKSAFYASIVEANKKEIEKIFDQNTEIIKEISATYNAITGKSYSAGADAQTMAKEINDAIKNMSTNELMELEGTFEKMGKGAGLYVKMIGAIYNPIIKAGKKKKLENQLEFYENAEKEVAKLMEENTNLQKQMEHLMPDFDKILKPDQTPTTTTTPTTLTPDAASERLLSQITSAAPKVFNVNIENLVDDFNVNTQNLKESTPKIKQMILETIMEAINDTQLAVR